MEVDGHVTNYGKTPLYLYLTVKTKSPDGQEYGEVPLFAGFVFPKERAAFNDMITPEGMEALYDSIQGVLLDENVTFKLYLMSAGNLDFRTNGMTFLNFVVGY